VGRADEIQVYDAGLTSVGVFNLTWHNNYTPNGAQVPAFPSALTSDDALVGVTEWAYGVTDWCEAGLYLPLYSIDRGEGAAINGFKLPLKALRTDRAVVIGEPTAGALDYQTTSIVRIDPDESRWFLGYPTITAHAQLPKGGMRGKGFSRRLDSTGRR